MLYSTAHLAKIDKEAMNLGGIIYYRIAGNFQGVYILQIAMIKATPTS